MHIKDLEIFNEMPFLFWVKDAQGKHLFGKIGHVIEVKPPFALARIRH